MNNKDDKIIKIPTAQATSLGLIKDALNRAKPYNLEPEVMWSALMIAMVNPSVTSEEAPMMTREIMEAALGAWDV